MPVLLFAWDWAMLGTPQPTWRAGRDAGREGCGQGGMQAGKDAGREGYGQGRMQAGRDTGREGCRQQGAGLAWLGTGLGVLAIGNGVTHYRDVAVNAGSLWSLSLSPAELHRTGAESSPRVPPRAVGWLMVLLPHAAGA